MLSSLNRPDFCTAIRNLLLSIMFISILFKKFITSLAVNQWLSQPKRKTPERCLPGV
jgi:hypothetical protein